MSIDKVEVKNPQGNLLTLSLQDISNGHVVRDIRGLDPVKSTIVTSSFATMEGQQKQASSRESRNIVFELGYAPNFSINETVRDLRSRLYRYFTSGTDVELTFYMTDGLTVKTTGTVESCEAPLFVREPQTDVSIICYDPDFIDVNLVEMHTQFTTTDVFGSPIVIDGTSKTGLDSLRFTANQSLDGFTVYHTTPSGTLRTMFVSVPLLVNDQVNLRTVKGDKSITLTRLGVTTSLMYAVSPQSLWVLLEPGENMLYVNTEAASPSPVLVDFHNRYGGL